MFREYDCVVIGTGLAPLVSAKKLIENGKSVLVLNPEREFFFENTELPFDPVFFDPEDSRFEEKISKQRSDQLFELLNPEYPGSVDVWPESKLGFFDKQIPRIFSRERVWVMDKSLAFERNLGKGFKFVDGAKAAYGIPGASPQKLKNSEQFFGLHVQNCADVEVEKYQNGFLRFIEEKLPKEAVQLDVWSLEFTKKGLSFHSRDERTDVVVKNAVHVFWTPRLTTFLKGFFEKNKKELSLPLGRRPYMNWILKSKEKINPKHSAVIQNGFFMATAPDDSEENSLSLFIKEPYLETDFKKAKETLFCNEGAFKKVSRLLEDYLGWQKFTISQLKSFHCTEWTDSERLIPIKTYDYKVCVSKHADGFVGDVLKAGLLAAESSLI